jgi:hypothetical protein
VSSADPALQVVVDHVRHFVSMSGQPAWQLAALASLSSCLELLAGTHEQVDSTVTVGMGMNQEARIGLFWPCQNQVWNQLTENLAMALTWVGHGSGGKNLWTKIGPICGPGRIVESTSKKYCPVPTVKSALHCTALHCTALHCRGLATGRPCCCPWCTRPGTASGSSSGATTYSWWKRPSRCSAVQCSAVVKCSAVQCCSEVQCSAVL